MSCLKHLWLSFWRKDQGLGLIETAVTLPLLLLVTFGLIEFGNMFITRYQVRDVSDSVANYLRTDPRASVEDLRNFTAKLDFGILNIGPDGDNSIYQKVRILSTTQLMNKSEWDETVCNPDEQVRYKDWSNPWLKDSDRTNDFNPYYIHVCYIYTHTNMTPLSVLSGGILPETQSLVGKAIAYTQPIFTCPEGQFLSNRGGAPVCTQINAACPNGKYLIRVVGTTPVCVKPSIYIQPRYRPSTSENDCSDYSDAVQVGMSGSDSGEHPGVFNFTGILFDDVHGTPRKVWCANLKVQ